MGTRHIIKIKVENEIKVQQYGQWDGYPTGQGSKIADFIHNDLQLDQFKDRVKALKFTADAELEKAWVEAGADPKSKFVTMSVSQKMRDLYPHFHRDCGADVLTLIQDGYYIKSDLVERNDKHMRVMTKLGGYEVKSTPKFIGHDGCEYEYLINLDKETVRVKCLYYKKTKTFKFEDFTHEAMEKLKRAWR